jgi:hypothetical protein
MPNLVDPGTRIQGYVLRVGKTSVADRGQLAQWQSGVQPDSNFYSTVIHGDTASIPHTPRHGEDGNISSLPHTSRHSFDSFDTTSLRLLEILWSSSDSLLVTQHSFESCDTSSPPHTPPHSLDSSASLDSRWPPQAPSCMATCDEVVWRPRLCFCFAMCMNTQQSLAYSPTARGRHHCKIHRCRIHPRQ